MIKTYGQNKSRKLQINKNKLKQGLGLGPETDGKQGFSKYCAINLNLRPQNKSMTDQNHSERVHGFWADIQIQRSNRLQTSLGLGWSQNSSQETDGNGRFCWSSKKLPIKPYFEAQIKVWTDQKQHRKGPRLSHTQSHKLFSVYVQALSLL